LKIIDVGMGDIRRRSGIESRDGGANPVSGYSLVEASSLEDAHLKAKGCPLLEAGGTIEIAEAMDM
jgi:hypothetical protein